MKRTDLIVARCPVCTTEPEIWVRAEVEPALEEDVSIMEALVADYPLRGPAFYRCVCGYEELVDPDTVLTGS